MTINKRNLFLKYVELEAFIANGQDLVSKAKRWLRWGTIKEALLYGGIAKLSVPFLKDVDWWIILIGVIIFSFINDALNYFVGKYNFKKGLWKIQNEWGQKTKQNNPYGIELKETLEEICKKLEIKSHFKDI